MTLTPKRPRGVTLVELLMGMVIMAIIGAVISSIFFASMKVWRRCSAHSQAEPPATMSINRISRELRNAYLVDNMGDDTITFTQPLTDAGGVNVLPLQPKTRISYYLSDDSGTEGAAGSSLWRKRVDVPTGQTQRRPLADNVLSMDFSYDATGTRVLKIYALSITVQGREGQEVYHSQFGTHVAFRN